MSVASSEGFLTKVRRLLRRFGVKYFSKLYDQFIPPPESEIERILLKRGHFEAREIEEQASATAESEETDFSSLFKEEERKLELRLEKTYLFDNLHESLAKSGLPISTKAYVGEMLAATLLSFFIGAMIGGIIGGIYRLLPRDVIIRLPIFPLFIFLYEFSGYLFFIVLTGLLVSVIIFISYYFAPAIIASGRKTEIERDLSSVASYMAAMASSGVPPDKIFSSLAREDAARGAITAEARKIARDIEIFGYDLLTALHNASKRSPSPRWASYLDGITSTVTSGGDLTFYLTSETRSLMKEQQEKTKERIESLGIIAEIFMVVGVVAPLLLVVMMAIVSIIAGNNPLLRNIILIVLLAGIYLFIPVLLFIIYLMVDISE